MANVLLKSMKFTRILNGRLSFSCVKPFINKPINVRSYKQTRQNKAYATAAYKFAPREESLAKSNTSTSDFITNLESVDKALYDIDFMIQRNGRTLLKNLSQILSAITTKEMTTSTHGLYLIRSCKYCYDAPPSERIQLVNEVWNRYQELGIPFDVLHYNALLDVHISNGLNFDPAEVLASMEDVNIEPNKATYMLVMKKYCLDGNINGASEILMYMKEKGLSADEKVFNYLIEGHLKNKDFIGAQDMIEVMKSSDLQPTVETHAILACGYAATGERDKMMSCLEQCGRQSSVESYLKVISALADSGNHKYIDDVLSLIENPVLYQQELINALVELIHKDHIDTAYKLSVLAWSPENQESVNIFIKQLIRVEKPVSEVINYCERILKEGLQKNIIFVASRAAAEYGSLDHVFPLFEKMLQNGYYVRNSNFWPMFKDKKPEDIWIILKKMSELGIPADFTTYSEVIYPALPVLKPDDIIKNVKDCNQILNTATDALFHYYCTIGNIDNAIHLTEICEVKVSPKLNINEFVDRMTNLNKDELRKYLKLLKIMFAKADGYEDPYEVQGRLLAALIIRKVPVLEELLNRAQDLQFSPQTLRICELELQEKNASRLPYLRKLREIVSKRTHLPKEENISVKEEDEYIRYLQNQNISCRHFLIKRLLYHIGQRDVARVTELLTVFDELKLPQSPILMSNLMVMHCMAGDLEKATMAMDKLKTEFPDFKLGIGRALEYVLLLLKYGKLDESVEVLKSFMKDPYFDTNKDQLFRIIKKLNVIFSDIENIEFVKKMQHLLLPLSNQFSSKRLFLENVIHYHLQRNNLPEAFEEFRNIILTHRTPVYLTSILKKCINQDEKNYLQKIVDLTASVTGKSNAMLELAVAFIETSNVEKAAKVIENLDREMDPRALESFCTSLSAQNKLYELEKLIELTSSLTHVDRERLYCIAFRTCAFRGDFKRATELFNILKSEIPEPKLQTIKYFEELLKKNNQPLSLNLVSKSAEPVPFAAESTKTLMEHLEAKNAESALKELSSLKKGYIRTLSIKTLTDLVDLCLENKCVKELSLNVQAMSYIIESSSEVLKPLVTKYAEAGDVEKFIDITSFMPDFSLMKLNFNFYFCKACITSGQYEKLLSELELHADKKNKLFSTIAFEELLKFPELNDRIVKLAEKCIESNYVLPMACIWAYHFANENFEKADEIFKKYSFSPDRVDNIIINHIKKNENVNLAQKYIDLVKPLSVRSRVKERAYGATLDLMVMKGMYDEAATLVAESEKLNLRLDQYYLSTLVTLKNALEKENKPVPFSVPLETSPRSVSASE